MKIKVFSPEKLKKCRTKAKISKTDLIFSLDQIGLRISRPTLDSWEEGYTTPKINDLLLLCVFFRVDTDYFFKQREVKA